MYLRPKTKCRLLVLLVGTALLLGGGAALVSIQLRRFDVRRMQYRNQAMDAYHTGDYPAALIFFHKYLINTSTDPNAIYAYGVCRLNVPTADYQYLLEAKSIFNRYLEFRPQDLAAEHRLLEVYRQLGYDTESLDLANAILLQDSNDLPALRAKAQALAGQFQYAAALPLSQKINELAPQDLQSQVLTLQLMQALHAPSQLAVDRADALLKRYPTDPRFQLVRAVAASMAGDLTGARQWLRAAATPAPTDAQFTLQLCVLFERIGMYADAQSLLQKSTAVEHPNADLLAALALRQWESGQFDSALQTLRGVDPDDPSSSSRLLALRALSLLYRNSPADPATAVAVIKSLSLRKADPVASAWVSLLRARFLTSQERLRESIRLLESALMLDPDNAVARYFLGFSYRDLGESELAVQAWRRAAAISPAWADPHIEIAKTLFADSQFHDGDSEAHAALARSPQSLAAQEINLQIRYAELGPAVSRSQLASLLAAATPIQAADPRQADTFPIYIALLSRSGRKSDAEAALRRALSANPSLPTDAIPSLASVCAAEHLRAGADLLAWITSAHVSSAPQAYQLATGLAALGHSADGLKLLLAGDPQSPPWQLATARYQENLGDATVRTTWTSLADSNPNNLAIQRAVLAANSTWSDRALIDRTIERVRMLTGEQAIQWRMARARWQLAATENVIDSANAVAASMAEVVRIAPSLAQPLVLWAHALEKLGDIHSAIDRLRSAEELSPDDSSIALELARLLQSQSDFTQAKSHLDRLAQDPAASSDRLTIAQMLAAQAEYDDAANILTAPLTAASVQRDLLLAQCLRNSGKEDQAARLFARLLRASPSDESVVRAAAWFYAEHDQMDKARSAVARAQHPILSANFEEDFAQPAAAREKYQAAVAAQPDSSAAWMALAGYQFRCGDFDAVDQVADQGLAHTHDDAELSALKNRAATLSQLPPASDLKDLILALSRNPTDPATTAVLLALSDCQKNHATNAETLARLKQVAARYPQSLPVQMLLVRRFLAADQRVEARELAQRATQNLPASADPPRLLYDLCSADALWKQALAAAQQWRARSLDHPLDADIALATALLQTGDARGAVGQISPYLDAARKDPDASAQSFAVMSLYCQALVQSDRWTDAQAMLEPLARQSLQWRIQWLNLSVFASDSAAAARWIDKIAILFPADSVDDQCALAAAWIQIAARFNDAASLERARAILTPLCRRPNPTPQASRLLADVQQQLHDPTADGK